MVVWVGCGWCSTHPVRVSETTINYANTPCPRRTRQHTQNVRVACHAWVRSPTSTFSPFSLSRTLAPSWSYRFLLFCPFYNHLELLKITHQDPDRKTPSVSRGYTLCHTHILQPHMSSSMSHALMSASWVVEYHVTPSQSICFRIVCYKTFSVGLPLQSPSALFQTSSLLQTKHQVWCFLFPLKIQSSTWLPILSRLVGCIHTALSFSDLTNPISSTSQLCSVLYQSIGACDMPYRLPSSLKIQRVAPLYDL